MTPLNSFGRMSSGRVGKRKNTEKLWFCISNSSLKKEKYSSGGLEKIKNTEKLWYTTTAQDNSTSTSAIVVIDLNHNSPMQKQMN